MINNYTMKTFRDYINLIESAQTPVAEDIPAQAGVVDPKIQFLQPTIQFAEKHGYKVTINPNPNGKLFAKLVNKQIEHTVRIGFSRGRDPGTKLEAEMTDDWDSQTWAWSARELAQDFKEFYRDALRNSPVQGQQGVAKDAELAEEFDLIERIIDDLANHNGVDAEMIWEDLESLDDDELYVFATTTTVMETEVWQKVNKKDKTDGMSKKAVSAYRREHPGSKLQTAVTTKPSKLKKGSKASKRRKSYCSRSRGQMKMHNISCAKTPDKAICKARRRWNC